MERAGSFAFCAFNPHNEGGRASAWASLRQLGLTEPLSRHPPKSLEATKDVDGKSILHNSMILYGSGNADGNRHTHANLPVILAGAGGGALAPGRHVQHDSKPMCNLFLTLADKMGVPNLESFGDSTGRLTNV